MQFSGAIKKIDQLGRIVIPKEIRSYVHIENGQPMGMYTNENNDIVLTPIRENQYQDLADLLKEAAQEVDDEKLVKRLKDKADEYDMS